MSTVPSSSSAVPGNSPFSAILNDETVKSLYTQAKTAIQSKL